MKDSEKHASMSVAPRNTMADEIINRSKHPEKCTPSSNDYNINYDVLLPRVGRGGGANL